MTAEDPAAGALERFAGSHGLTYAPSTDLPGGTAFFSHENATLGGVASGTLPGELDGSVVQFTYEVTDSEHHVERYPSTIAYARVPETMGFAPHLTYRLAIGVGSSVFKRVEIDSDVDVGGDLYAYEGTSDSWLRQLFSPKLAEWLSRSPGDLRFELVNGLLLVQRDGLIADPAELEGLCRDASFIADALRAESIESVEAGGAKAAGAQEEAPNAWMEAALADVQLDTSPPDIAAATGAFRGWLLGYPAFWFKYLAASLGITLVISVFLLPITIGFYNDQRYAAIAIFELAIFALVALWAIRHVLNDFSSWYASEAFFRRYARDRGLQVEGKLGFAASHAEANLPFDPEHVFSGALPGGANGALALCGDGTDRESRIAIVAGSKGPLASAELRASPGGLSAKDLDDVSARLAQQLASSPAAGAGA